MSGFFESDIVREAITEMEELQQEIIEKMMYAPFFDNEEKKEHLALMRDFLDKQRNLYFRISLSDDPEAQIMKDRIKDAAQLLGMDENSGVNEFFDIMEESIKKLEEQTEG